MKPISLLLTLIGMSLVSASCADVRFTWTPYPTNDMILEYRIYQAEGDGGFVPIQVIPNITLDSETPSYDSNAIPTTVTLYDVKPGKYRWYLTAVNVWEESPPSNIIETPAGAPTQSVTFKLKFNRKLALPKTTKK